MTGPVALSLPVSESAQTAEHSASTLVVVLAVVVFVGAYVLIATEWVHRVGAALFGAALMVVIGATDADSAFFAEDTAVDWNVVFLLLGMMIIVGVLKQTGLFGSSRSGLPNGLGAGRSRSWRCCARSPRSPPPCWTTSRRCCWSPP